MPTIHKLNEGIWKMKEINFNSELDSHDRPVVIPFWLLELFLRLLDEAYFQIDPTDTYTVDQMDGSVLVFTETDFEEMLYEIEQLIEQNYQK